MSRKNLQDNERVKTSRKTGSSTLVLLANKLQRMGCSQCEFPFAATSESNPNSIFVCTRSNLLERNCSEWSAPHGNSHSLQFQKLIEKSTLSDKETYVLRQKLQQMGRSEWEFPFAATSHSLHLPIGCNFQFAATSHSLFTATPMRCSSHLRQHGTRLAPQADGMRHPGLALCVEGS